jgi:hypothetical protein
VLLLLLLAVVAATGVDDADTENTACAAAAISDGTFLGMCGRIAVAAVPGTVEVVGVEVAGGVEPGGGRTRLNFFVAFPVEVSTSKDGSTVDMSESSDNLAGVCPSMVAAWWLVVRDRNKRFSKPTLKKKIKK